MTRRAINVVIGVVSLCLGGIVYILFCPDTWFSRTLGFGSILPGSLTGSARFISFYLPDFLWAFSLGCLLIAVFLPKKKGLFLCALTVFAVGCLWEIMQFFGVVSGTGDFFDCLLYLSAALLSSAVNFRRTEK